MKRPNLLLWCLLFFVGCLCAPEKKSKSPSSDSVLLLYTTSVQGYVTPCGCTQNPLGGIDRLATVIEQAKRTHDGRVILIDAGQLLFDPKAMDQCQDDSRIDLLLSIYSHLGFLGTVPGEIDEARGKAFCDAKLTKHHLPPFGIHQARKALIEKRGDFKIGITAFRLDKDQDVEKTQKELAEQIGIMKRADVNAVVVVAEAPIRVTKRVVAQLAYVDIVIQGAFPGESPMLPEALSPNGPWLMSAGMQGQYLGIVEFHFLQGKSTKKLVLDDRELRAQGRKRLLETRVAGLKKQLTEKRDAAYEKFLRERLQVADDELRSVDISGQLAPLSVPHFVSKAIPLDKKIPPTPAVQSQLQAYERSIPRIVAECEAKVECPVANPGTPTFVGAATCLTCHTQAGEVWHGTAHAKAWQTLEKVQKTSDRTCIGCHSVGFLKPGGYCRVGDVDFRKNVQCESCHGAGSLHAASGDKRLIQREVPESTCRGCHHVPHIESTESFVYDEKVLKILGPGHGHALLQKLQHQRNTKTGS